MGEKGPCELLGGSDPGRGSMKVRVVGGDGTCHTPGTIILLTPSILCLVGFPEAMGDSQADHNKAPF